MTDVTVTEAIAYDCGHRAGHAERDAEVAALRAENGRLLQLLAKAADTMGRAEATVNALIAALGIPPAPPKVAPWEAAFREWESLGMTDAPHWAAWKAAWAACEQHYNIIGE
jgi:broad specificity phosphatase PhoE